MDFINKVEIKGIVGSVKQSLVGHYMAVRFSVCTNHIYSKDSEGIIETTWFPCYAVDIKNMEKVEKGKLVHVTGRLKSTRYVNNEGMEQTIYEIICQTIEVSDI